MKQHAPLVSIIIPCYNAGKFVGEAIQSALGQTYPNKEVIVIDDGSTDRSLEVIKSFGEKIRWETGVNRGGSVARNHGIELAKGELIQFLDADDLLHSRKLEKMVPIAVEKGPGFLTICDWEMCSESGSLRSCRPNYSDEDPLLHCLHKSLIITSPIHWRAKLEEVKGFREDLPCCQEFDLHLRLASRGIKFFCIPEILLTVRRQPGSVSADYVKVLNWRLEIFQKIYASLQTEGGLTIDRRRTLARACAGDGRLLVRRGRPEQGAKSFNFAAKIIPFGELSAFDKWYNHAMAAVIGPVRTEMAIHACKRRLGQCACEICKGLAVFFKKENKQT